MTVKTASLPEISGAAVAVRERHLDLARLVRQRAHELLLEAGHDARRSPAGAGSPCRRRRRTACRRSCPRSRSGAGRHPAAGRGSAGVSNFWRDLAKFSIACSTLSAGVSATRRVRLIDDSSTCGTSGSTSTFTSNSRSLPSSNEVTSIFGRSAGRSSFSPMVFLEPSSTASSRTSPRIERPYCFLSRGSGALPGRKPGQPHRLRQLLEPRPDPLLDLASGDSDLELPLEALGHNLLYLHRSRLDHRPARARVGGRFIPAKSGAGLVRAARLELARLAPQEPKSCVSTNSTTPARGNRDASARRCAL